MSTPKSRWSNDRFAAVHPEALCGRVSAGLHVRFDFHGILLELGFARTMVSQRLLCKPGEMTLPPALTFVLTFMAFSRSWPLCELLIRSGCHACPMWRY